ncbi:unnamed protein product [Coffea canephora]|uniref:Aminotransferase class IV n=2 Tax=Coffea TaxID=13442 RepID=A0A068U9M7_COFCA|nr:uncharacterized protein LOC113708948 isoform X2 [Coffea arabica]CDP04308.1 unnamed protein product [Coffea canephora]
MSNFSRFLFTNGVLVPPADTPPVATLLQSCPGAYTTTRTHNNGAEIMFWQRHLSRLSNSVKVLLNSRPELLFKAGEDMVPFVKVSEKSLKWDLVIRALVNDSMGKALPFVLKERKCGEEMSITTLVSGNLESLREIEDVNEERLKAVFDVYLHFGGYVPRVFGIQGNGARLAVVGRGRDIANAKYSDWVRLRKDLEKLRPPSTTELLLSNNGDHILEGCLTNFFVVCGKDECGEIYEQNDFDYERSVEVQTAPVSEGVLPGVIRQVIIEICLRNGIPFREVAPSWSQHNMWREAFITNSLRIVEHVETILVPSSWKSMESKTSTEIRWEEKQFEVTPGRVTSIIQKEVMEKAGFEAYAVALYKD